MRVGDISVEFLDCLVIVGSGICYFVGDGVCVFVWFFVGFVGILWV